MTDPTDEVLLAALADHAEWVSAETVMRHLRDGVYGGPTVQLVGRRLSRLARQGRCLKRFDGPMAMGYYRRAD